MSTSGSNGVIRIGRKGIRKFAFGDDGVPFEVDVVVAFQEWISIDDSFRPVNALEDGSRSIPTESMAGYHQAAVEFVARLGTVVISDPMSKHDNRVCVPNITTAEALDFIARLRECYDELAAFFRPRLSEERASPATSEAELRFSAEES